MAKLKTDFETEFLEHPVVRPKFEDEDHKELEDSEGYVMNCPFCGTDYKHLIVWEEPEDKENEIERYWYVLCDKCQAKGPESETELGACDLWNERRGD